MAGGELLMFDASFIANPYPTYAKLREAAPIHWAPDFGSGAWLLPRFEGVAAALPHPHLSSKRSHRLVSQYPAAVQTSLSEFNRSFSKWIIFLDPPIHSTWRKMITKGFSTDTINRARPRIEALANRLIDRVADNRRMEFIRDFAYLIPAVTMVELLGVPSEDQGQIIEWTDDIAKFFGNPNSPIDVAHAAQSALSCLCDYFGRLLELRRTIPGDDLVSLLLQAEEHDELIAPDDLPTQCAALLFAGHETTRNLLGNGLLALINNPEQFSLLRQDPSLIPAAVKEIARYDTPAQINSRVVAKSFEMYGRELKEGEIVIAITGSANRDSEAIPKADEFDVTRRGAPILSFGKGAHYCVGAALASAEAEIAFATIIERMPNVKLASKELKWVNNANFRGLQALPVEF